MTGTPREPVKDRMQNVEDEASATAKLLPTKASFAGKVPPYVLHHHSSRLEADKGRLLLGNEKHRRCPIQSTKVEGHPGAGMGRVVRFSDPVSLPDILDRIHLGLGSLKGFQVAVPQGKQASDVMIGSIGICAGSGGHLFAEMEKAGENVDLLFTGELSHHEALAAIEKGRCVICLLHSNTERGFLHSVLKHQLERTVQEEVATPAFFRSCIYTDKHTVGPVANRKRARWPLQGARGRSQRRQHGRARQRSRPRSVRHNVRQV